MSSLPRLSPGRFTALWVILRSVAKLGDGVGRKELLSFARRSGLRCGDLPIPDGLKLALAGAFLTSTDPVRLTELGKEALARCNEEEPSHDVLRLLVSVLVLRYPPTWVAYWQGDPTSIDLVLPDPTRELLREAKLLSSISIHDLEAWAWWDALKQVPPIEETAGQRKAVGDAAEELSFLFEKQRLAAEGFVDLAERVRWVARESPAYGFDILSFCGVTHNASAPRNALAIEVKGMSVVVRESLNFYITHHEWGTAVSLGNSHIFHLWDGVAPAREHYTDRVTPITFGAQFLKDHLPQVPLCNDSCRWETSLILLPSKTLIGDHL
ncbi:MAG: DUF3883 domain-containing protein [Desulfobacteraceae bacterium]|nr:MAG: DUF3883 domain-containing protein [Desulfobacteraceae bacterium]